MKMTQTDIVMWTEPGWVILTELVIVVEAKSINMSLFWQSEGQVGPTEGIDEVRFLLDCYDPWC